MLNKQRDDVLDISERQIKLNNAQKKVLIYNDFLPLSIGTCIFLICFSIIIFTSPFIIIDDTSKIKWSEIICFGGIGIFSLIATASMTISVIIDFRKMKRSIETPEIDSTQK